MHPIRGIMDPSSSSIGNRPVSPVHTHSINPVKSQQSHPLLSLASCVPTLASSGVSFEKRSLHVYQAPTWLGRVISTILPFLSNSQKGLMRKTAAVASHLSGPAPRTSPYAIEKIASQALKKVNSGKVPATLNNRTTKGRVS